MWHVTMLVHSLRSLRILPSWEVSVREVPEYEVGGEVAHRHFWTKSGALRWAEQWVNQSPQTFVCFAMQANWFRPEDGDLPSLLCSGRVDICPEGLELFFGEAGIELVPQS